jgi:hypothetical protein
MGHFQFQKDNRVKEKQTGRDGTVMYVSTDPTTNIPFCRVKFDDGPTRDIAEDNLILVSSD